MPTKMPIRYIVNDIDAKLRTPRNVLAYHNSIIRPLCVTASDICNGSGNKLPALVRSIDSKCAKQKQGRKLGA